MSLNNAVIFFNRAGRGVKIEGLGTYLPNIKLDGTFDAQHRLDRTVKDGLNAPNTFTGTIINRENIGKTSDELVVQWKAAFPWTDLALPRWMTRRLEWLGRHLFVSWSFLHYRRAWMRPQRRDTATSRLNAEPPYMGLFLARLPE